MLFRRYGWLRNHFSFINAQSQSISQFQNGSFRHFPAFSRRHFPAVIFPPFPKHISCFPSLRFVTIFNNSQKCVHLLKEDHFRVWWEATDYEVHDSKSFCPCLFLTKEEVFNIKTLYDLPYVGVLIYGAPILFHSTWSLSHMTTMLHECSRRYRFIVIIKTCCSPQGGSFRLVTAFHLALPFVLLCLLSCSVSCLALSLVSHVTGYWSLNAWHLLVYSWLILKKWSYVGRRCFNFDLCLINKLS